MNYRNTYDECPSCDSTYKDRNDTGNTYTGLSECPYCGTEKCCICDMGDDVECPSCYNETTHNIG